MSGRYTHEIDVDDLIDENIVSRRTGNQRAAVTTTDESIAYATSKASRVQARKRHRTSRRREEEPAADDEELGLSPSSWRDESDESYHRNLRVDSGYNASGIMDDKLKNRALILALERTFFAALNNAWLLVLGGIGLMSVGNNDNRATRAGIFVLFSGIGSAAVAYIVHVGRVQQISQDKDFRFSHTILWTSLIISLTIAALGFELYFGTTYPYLERKAAVVVYNDTGPIA